MLTLHDRKMLRLLKLAPFTRRAQGGWRFGAKTISSPVVERMIASRRAELVGDRVEYVPLEAMR